MNFKSGLYVLVFLNLSNQDIYDNNPGREKIVVYPQSISIKPGKFEGGLLKRMSEYRKHLHIKPERNGKYFVFDECFSGLIAFDTHELQVGVDSANSARVFECYWNSCILDLLMKDGRLSSSRFTQNKRTEWWHIDDLASYENLLISLKERTLQVATKIFKAAEIMSF